MPTKKKSTKTAATKTPRSSHSTQKTVSAKSAKPAKSASNPIPAEPSPAKKTSLKRELSSKYQKIKDILVRQKASLLTEAEVALNELPGQSMFPDMGDQASAETDTNFMLRLRGREQRLLKKIDEALDRIETNTFGICDDCGREIDIKRLEARPVTTMCIECKVHQEEDEKRREV